jgi:hypothetical protein
MNSHQEKATFMYRHRLLVLAIATALVASRSDAAQSRHERKARQLEESAQPKALAGGVAFQTEVPIAKCFDAVLNHLKRQGLDIDLTDREAGRIVTVMEVAGGHSQTGTRILVTLIKDGDSRTSVRVAVTAQKRKKLLVTEPWSDPKVEESESAKTAAEMEKALQGER